MILRHIPPDQPVLVPMDDTTAQHRGKCVYGKGCHHDAVRSSHNHIVFRWGHRWVVLMHWFPKRKFVFLGDGGYASHELAP